MNRKAVLWLVAVAALALAAFGVKLAADAKRPKEGDEEQLAQMLYDGERAAERRDAAGLGRLISADYDDGIMRAAQVRYQIGDYLRQQRNVEINIPMEQIQIQVDPAAKTGTVQFRAQFTRQTEGGAAYTDLDMTLQVRKERVYYYWIFPGEEWRVTSAGGYGALGE